jgi:hypothetical protein
LNFSIIIFILYSAILVGMLFLARKSTYSKRVVIKKLFNLEDSQIRSTGYDDTRIRKFTSAGWSIAFVMAGVLLVPTVALGADIWVLIPSILAEELVFLLMGLVVIREAGIINWYRECYISNFQFFKTGLGLSMLAIVLGNVAFAIPFNPLGLLVQMAAVGVMVVALYSMISPILGEMKYYTEVGTAKEPSSAETGET